MGRKRYDEESQVYFKVWNESFLSPVGLTCLMLNPPTAPLSNIVRKLGGTRVGLLLTDILTNTLILPVK